MAKRIIEISVNDEYVVGSGVVIGAAGDDESATLRVAFSDTWAGLNIYATFRDSKGESPTVELLMPSMLVLGEAMKYDVVVPAAATAHAGKMSVVFSGFAVSEVSSYEIKTGTEENIKLVYRDAVINTTNAYFRVLPSDFSALDVKDHTEATVLEKVLSEINTLGDVIADFDKTIAEYEANEEARSETVRFFENKGAIIVSEEEPDVSMAHVWIDPAPDEAEISLLDSTCISHELSDDTDKVPSVALLKQIAEDNTVGDNVLTDEDIVQELSDTTDKVPSVALLKQCMEQCVKSDELGDIETALDSIIAIQDSLIGAKEITFTIKDSYNNTATYTALEGMTWGEWCNRKYNTLGLIAHDNILYCDMGDDFYVYLYDVATSMHVDPSELVIANGSYFLG